METKAMGKSELAIQYSPNISTTAALRRLERWIVLNRDLKEALAEAGYNPMQRILTKRQVELIYYYLGEP